MCIHIAYFPFHCITQGLKFEVIPSSFEETLNKGSFPSPSHYAMETSLQKTLEVAKNLVKDVVSSTFQHFYGTLPQWPRKVEIMLKQHHIG